ncbi:uncharacterized protein LOC110603890 isoform X2 [Manihot esculenta]|uniref:uncharacterized protein LOC110603890 isoform X2 n=1 Tax=Manihot esculenta TaxID=3983 RepID=UPI000B5D265A|nr:uncharacterized protein LOC110603890 isoform X2 [Manihot esculenta]
MHIDAVPSSSGTSRNLLFKIGDRVRYISGGLYPSASSSRDPPNGIHGKVELDFEDNPLSKIGVRFDKPVTDGVDHGGLCEGGHGYFCNVIDLHLDNVEDLDKLLINTLFESHPGGLLFTKFGSNQTALLDLAFPDSFGRLYDRGKEVPKATKVLTKLYPNKAVIHMPQDEVLPASWKHQLDRDVETLKMKGNLNHLRAVRNLSYAKLWHLIVIS